MMKRWTVFLLGAAAIGVSGCGLRGDLDRPPPLWGQPPAMTDEEYDASRSVEDDDDFDDDFFDDDEDDDFHDEGDSLTDM